MSISSCEIHPSLAFAAGKERDNEIWKYTKFYNVLRNRRVYWVPLKSSVRTSGFSIKIIKTFCYNKHPSTTSSFLHIFSFIVSEIHTSKIILTFEVGDNRRPCIDCFMTSTLSDGIDPLAPLGLNAASGLISTFIFLSLLSSPSEINLWTSYIRSNCLEINPIRQRLTPLTRVTVWAGVPAVPIFVVYFTR